MADAAPPSPRDQDVIAYTAFQGVRNDVVPERFDTNDLAVGENCDLDKTGRLSRRAGYTQRRAGASHSLWADPQQDVCLFVASGQLMRLQPDFSAGALRSLGDGVARMSYHRVNDRVYFSNGVDSGILEAGAARGWGMPVPPLPGVSSGVGAMTAGTYQFVLTWLRADGQESGAGMAGAVTVPPGAGLTFALPAAHPEAAAVVLYMTTANGTTLYAAATAPASAASLTYSNDGAELSEPLSTMFRQPPPPGQLVAFYRGRMFVAVGSVLYMSDPGGYELFDLRQYLDLDGRITLLAPMTDKEQGDTGANSGFFIGTDRSCGVLVGMGPDDFQYVPKQSYGAVLGALDYVDGALFRDGASGSRQLPMWLTTQGICVGMPNLEVLNLTRGRYIAPVAGQGAALFMPGPNRFLATGNL